LKRPILFAVLLIWAGIAQALTISGTVTLSGGPFSGVALKAPKATCSDTDASGAFSCTVPSSWDGTLAPYLNGYVFSPASISYGALSANQAGQNFAASLALGLRSELGLYRPGTSQFFLDYNLDHVVDRIEKFGAPGDIGLSGDLDGNGVSDLVLYRNGTWFIDFNLSATVGSQVGFGGVAGDIPLLGDMNGDGRDDLIIYRSGTWYVNTAFNGVSSTYHFGGVAGDIPLVGDLNGDGKLDLIIYRNGTWFVDFDPNAVKVDATYHFGGVAGDVPMVFDYDGDGRDDLVIYRNGTWFVCTKLNCSGPDVISFGYGAGGDKPLAGFFNRANTLFVRAGASCTTGCSQTNPYGSIQTAWQAAADGSIIRVASGTYPENLVFSYPGIQYAPGKFGKNNVKLLGVSAATTIVSPTSGDALYLQAASGYVLRNLRFQSQDTSNGNGRGVVTAGGPQSVLPTFPGAQLSMRHVDVMENNNYNVLLTGSTNASIDRSRLSRSKTQGGLTMWNETYASLTNSEASNNGYTLSFDPAVSIPDGGKGIDLRQDSELLAFSNNIDSNQVFGVIGIDRSVVRLDSNDISDTGLTAIIICGAASNDQTVSITTNNLIADNGTIRPDLGWNGMEIYTSCLGSHTITGNTFIGNSLNGLFIGSGTTSVLNNTFQSNVNGLVSYSNTTVGVELSSTNTNLAVYGNLFNGNTHQGFFAQRNSGSTFALNATIGGTAGGQANTFKNQTGAGYHGISCAGGGENVVCPSGGNVFINNSDNIASTCPLTCMQ
jgi:Right handed beta helix region/FG-GAP-like repeat